MSVDRDYHDGEWKDSGDRVADVQARLADELKRQNDLQERALAAAERERANLGAFLPGPRLPPETTHAIDRARAVLSLAREFAIHWPQAANFATAASAAIAFVDAADAWAEADGKKHGYDHRNPFGAR